MNYSAVAKIETMLRKGVTLQELLEAAMLVVLDPGKEKAGLYNKFFVVRRDGSSLIGGKHEHCEYFVLDWNHDKFAIPAMTAYAEACAEEYPELAADIRNKIKQCKGE